MWKQSSVNFRLKFLFVFSVENNKRKREEDYKIADVMSKEVNCVSQHINQGLFHSV